VLVDEPLVVRRDRLRKEFGAERGRFEFVGGDDIHGETGAATPDPGAAASAAADDAEGGDRGDQAGGRAGVVAGHVAALCRAAVAAGCEGLMVKSLDGPTAVYAPAKRCETAWIKLKKDYLADGLADTLDLVPIAAWHGSGRKAGWLSPFLCAVFNPETEQYEALCKVMSGFTDVQYLLWQRLCRSECSICP
jgi:hypothetical protein